MSGITIKTEALHLRHSNVTTTSRRDGKKHGSTTAENSQAATKRAKTSTSSRKIKETINNTKAGRSLSTYKAPFREFDGNTIYRNRIVEEEEHRADGHYSIEELILPGCTSALCTTFHSSQLPWLTSIFQGIPQLTVVTAAPSGSQHVIGNADVQRMADTQEWYWVKARPHTGGCFHSKVLLFRSNQGLRVVISGNNLTRGQWECHRDVFWAQDFPYCGHLQHRGSFGHQLRTILSDMMACADTENQTMMNGRLVDLFDGIDFVEPRAQLVYSFPRIQGSNESVGGYKQLSHAVRRALESRAMTISDNVDDSSDDDEDLPSVRMELPPRLFATSGSFGNLQPDLMLQMYEAMNGKESLVSKQTKWDDCDSLVKVLYPSIQTAATIDLIGLSGCLRHMPQQHFDTIPEASCRRVFHDAIPNPPTKSPASLDKTQSFHAVTHGKFLYNSRGVLYVGSHNFSKNAWGIRNSMPKNVEIGVVLASRDEDRRAEWRSRLPCQLVGLNAKSPPSYKPYAGWKTIVKIHPLAETWTNLWRRFHALHAAKDLYKRAEGVLPENDKWLIATPLEDQTLEELQTMLHDYGPIIEECVKEALGMSEE